MSKSLGLQFTAAQEIGCHKKVPERPHRTCVITTTALLIQPTLHKKTQTPDSYEYKKAAQVSVSKSWYNQSLNRLWLTFFAPLSMDPARRWEMSSLFLWKKRTTLRHQKCHNCWQVIQAADKCSVKAGIMLTKQLEYGDSVDNKMKPYW